MKNVLIALDFDSSSQKVADTGYALAKALGAETFLLHVVFEPAYYSSIQYSPITGFDNLSGLNLVEGESPERLISSADEYLNQFKSYLGDEAIHTITESGDFADTILSTARDMSADLIVVGTHNRQGIKKLFSNNISEKVVHHSTVPVLLVPVSHA